MYNKQQRKEIYYKALKRIVSRTNQTETAFMCHELSRAIDILAPFIEHDELLSLFPEWSNCQPIGHTYAKSNVWADDETEGCNTEVFNSIRETIMCICIAQLS